MFAGDANQNKAVLHEDLTKISTPELIAMSQDMGRAQDDIKAKRKAIAVEMQRREQAVVVQGQTLEAKAQQ
jgi:hypothetical protein